MHNLKFTLICLCLVFASFFAFMGRAHALEVKSIRFGQHGTAMRTVMDLDAEADFRASVADNPPRIIVDLPDLAGKPIISRRQLPRFFKDVRLEPVTGGLSRLTFLLEGPATIRSAFLMPAAGKMPVRLVIDAGRASPASFAKARDKTFGTLPATTASGNKSAQDLPFAAVNGPKLAPVSRPDFPASPVTAPVIAPAGKAAPVPLVVIDPGHGGIDPGASGSGVIEKNVTLEVSKHVRDALLKTGRYRVQLTRDRDFFIRLPERVRIARRAGADLFVSIHADSVASGGETAHGASFYTLSDQATDAQTARLAARENQADLLGGIDLPGDDRDVANILIDLTVRETTNESKRLAGRLVTAFKKENLPMLPSPHRSAGFMVLKAADIPSALIELGFLSNPDEVKKLADPAWRTALGNTIAGGIDAWFAGRPGHAMPR